MYANLNFLIKQQMKIIIKIIPYINLIFIWCCLNQIQEKALKLNNKKENLLL